MNKTTRLLAISMLAIMAVLLYFSALNDSATMDELAHIPSAYSYLSQKDYRLNPEHPPLIKDLSAVPLLFLNLNFPTDIKEWKDYINGQWDMGRIFIYESGNDADRIIFWSRLPIMLVALLFGWLLFRWVRSLYGDKVGLLALFFFAFSPTFIAHSRYVTTDLGAAFGFFIAISSFLTFLTKKDLAQNDDNFKGKEKKWLLISGVAFGIAQLLKFSLVIVAPIFVLYGGLWVFLRHYGNFNWKNFIKDEAKMMGQIIIIGLIGVALIWPVYAFHTWNYPPEKQANETNFLLSSFGLKPLSNLVIWMAETPVFRSLGHYFLGVLMVMQRAAGGNTTYFVGQISASGWSYYFPLLYLLKEHLAFHIFTLIALILGVKNIKQSAGKNMAGILGWMKENFVLTASIIFIAIYWLQAISSPLNIGVRHVLPTFPFIYLMISRQIVRWVKSADAETSSGFLQSVKNLWTKYTRPAPKLMFSIILLAWMIIVTLISFPYYLSFYNELAGGTAKGYKIATDSNYDWGQDLKRLKDWVEKYNRCSQTLSPEQCIGNKISIEPGKPIEKIAIDYFGGGNPKYYFGEQFEPWWSSRGKPADIKWFAISLTYLMGSHARPVDNFIQKPEDTYSWLKGLTPVARAGTSIFIYKLD
jgi:hypothetical protein